MAAPPDAQAQLKSLVRNAAEVIPEEEFGTKLERSLSEGRPLRVKLGLDPTSADVTLGWAVVLRKLLEFQDLGHTAVLIVGDFTARVGDPSAKSETRPRLSKEIVKANADRVLGQFGKVLSDERLEIRYNSEWLEPLTMEDILRMTSLYTVARMLERDDFAKRFAENRPISIMEFLYPLLQAMDSVAVKADVELGGNDQKFNLLVGRQIQKDYGQDQQVVFTMPLLVGLDGVRVMGQSLGNYVGIDEPPEEMFGKLMRIPDGFIVMYLRLCTTLPDDEIGRIESGMADGSMRPDQAKRRMAREVVALYRGAEAAAAAEERFDLVYREHEIPQGIKEVTLRKSKFEGDQIHVAALLEALNLVSSRSEARRLIRQHGVRVNGDVVRDPEMLLDRSSIRGQVWQVGRRRFVRITDIE